MTSWLDKRLKDTIGYNDPYDDTDRFGVEVEFEGSGITANSLYIHTTKTWKVVPDGSLRGESFEAVMRKPLGLAETCTAVKELYTLTTNNGAKIHDSMRAGLHVHLNCQNITMKRLFTFMTAYYCLEDLIVDYLGEERAGNLFCLRLSDAEDLSFAVETAIACKNIMNSNHFTNDNLRYAAMNLVSLSKFGTLEFRAMRTPTSPEPVIEWLKILDHMFINVKKFNDPAELVSAMSANGEKEVISALLPEDFAKKLYSRPDFEFVLYRCIRNIQHWVFQTNWSEK